MREAKCMREVHKRACALKLASEQRASDFKPGISRFVAELFCVLERFYFLLCVKHTAFVSEAKCISL